MLLTLKSYILALERWAFQNQLEWPHFIRTVSKREFYALTNILLHYFYVAIILLCYLGGTAQPGCTWDMVGACAHGRAYEYYIESISRPDFYAIKCESFEKFTTGTCSLTNEIAQMGGEPGNRK